MKVFKIILSLFLLLTYSFGFAHSLVPHCNDFTTKKTHTYHQHSAKNEHNSKHNHITHNSHFDEGVFDYLMCLVDETENPVTACFIEHCFTINNNDVSLKKIIPLQIVVVLFSVFQPVVQNEKITPFITDVEINYSSPLVKNSPHRGPPFIS